MKAITVLLCDDRTVLREGLRLRLGSEQASQGDREAEDGRRAVREPKRLRPEVIVLNSRCQGFGEAMAGSAPQRLHTRTTGRRVDQSSNGSPPFARGGLCPKANS